MSVGIPEFVHGTDMQMLAEFGVDFPIYRNSACICFYLVAIKYSNWAVDSLTSVLKLCIII